MEDDAFELEKRVSARVGTEIKGKWKIERLLGLGGMAAVYAATHRNGKRVALKILHREVSAIPDLRARFLREAYASNKVLHPGAVSVSDDDETEDGSAFLVMDLLEGETVGARWISLNKRVDVKSVLEIADQLLDVLAVAHDEGIVHRDIKPDNLFLVRGSGLKVLDFGIARVRELSSATRGATYAGAVMGTPAFMPPEQARSRWADVDAQSDIWAVGATMFTLLVGRFVHDAETPNEQLAQAITRPAPPIVKVAPNVPEDVAQIVDRALKYEKNDRFPNARAMQKAVRVALAGVDRSQPVFATAPTVAAVSSSSGETLLTSEAGSPAQPAMRVRAIAIGGAIAAAAIAIAFVFSRGGSAATAPAAEPATAEVSAPAAPSNVARPTPRSEVGAATAASVEASATPSGTALSIDALPDSTSRSKSSAASRGSNGASPPSTTTPSQPDGTKSKKRRNLGF